MRNQVFRKKPGFFPPYFLKRYPKLYYKVGLDAWGAALIGSLTPGRLSDWLILKMYG